MKEETLAMLVVCAVVAIVSKVTESVEDSWEREVSSAGRSR
jgi:hypothetical protein